MTIRAFLKYLYDKVQVSFPQATIAYQYDEASRTHLIKVTPQSIYESDEFLDLEAELNQQWITQTANSTEEDFCIVSTNSLSQLDQSQIVYIPELTQAFSVSGQELEEKGYTVASFTTGKTPEFEDLTSPEFEPTTSGQYSLAA